MKNHTIGRMTLCVMVTILFIMAFTITGCSKVPKESDIDDPIEDPDVIVKFEGKYIDVHTHISPTGMSFEQIIKNMDTEGIDKMVVMSVPAGKNDTQEHYGVPEAAEKYPDRFIVLYGGEAITMLETAATTGKYTKAEEKRFASLLEQAMSSGNYKGIGEIGLRHFIPKNESDAIDLTISGDHPWMFIMSDIAAKYNVPIDVHMEATTETVKGLESLLAHNKNTIIIWDHAGWGNTDMATPQLISQLMEKYPNLYSSIKIRKDKTTPSNVSIFNSDKQITPEWISLFKKYPDRFMIGSDIKAGIREDEFTFVKDHLKLLSQLPPDILKKIERENAEKIFQIN
ncbi:MAG: hypothetical protein FD133_1278 [Erysipelotrichaceae bacterium]|nr:MAG: hypothetical protein FD179_180 [Erysipelotrichaceae bacterium]TXT17645.1 MAG: hypothetical protein FD133_1278 [Erysipelotrichaceae bacterium]